MSDLPFTSQKKNAKIKKTGNLKLPPPKTIQYTYSESRNHRQNRGEAFEREREREEELRDREGLRGVQRRGGDPLVALADGTLSASFSSTSLLDYPCPRQPLSMQMSHFLTLNVAL